MMKWKAASFLLMAAVFFVCGGVVLAGWQALHLEPGHFFEYEIVLERDGEESWGEFHLWASETEPGLLYISAVGHYAGQEFGFSTEADRGSPEGIYEQIAMGLVTQLPEELMEVFFVTLWLPWYETPLYGAEMSAGWTFEDYDLGTVTVAGKEHYGGRDGWLLEIAGLQDTDYVLNTAIDPALPLPIMSRAQNIDLEGSHVHGADIHVVLLQYQEDALPDYAEDADLELAMPDFLQAVRPEGPLAEVLDHFQDHGLEVGELSPKAYEMMGASSGFGVEVEGHDVELYRFDPDVVADESLANFENARETGLFRYPGSDMDIPVYVRADILMTGLEFGTIVIHPERDLVVEVFEQF